MIFGNACSVGRVIYYILHFTGIREFCQWIRGGGFRNLGRISGHQVMGSSGYLAVPDRPHPNFRSDRIGAGFVGNLDAVTRSGSRKATSSLPPPKTIALRMPPGTPTVRKVMVGEA